MIASIAGSLVEKSPQSIVVEVQGIGYQVHCPLSTFYRLPEVNQSVRLRIYTHVREDALQLYGFLESREKEVFLLLLGISGVGPRLALNILSGLPLNDFIKAVLTGDVVKLGSIPGVGKKTAERLALELKDRIQSIETEGESFQGPESSFPISPLEDDAISALVNLGYKASQAKQAVQQTKSQQSDVPSLELLITEALRLLSK